MTVPQVEVGILVEVRAFVYRNGVAHEVWLTGIVTYVDQTGLDVRLAKGDAIRLGRWGKGDTWREMGEVFA